MYRAIDTEVWDDTWFAELDPDGKLLFLYLLTNRRTTACGAFEISVRMIVNETGIQAERVAELIDTFNPRVLWFRDDNLIWVRNFFRRQYKNANEKQVAALRSALDAFPQIITDSFRIEYPSLFNEEDTPPIAYTEAIGGVSIGVPPVAVAGTEANTVPDTAPIAGAERVTALPPATVMDTVESLLLAPWINDEPAAVERAVCRAFKLVPDFNTRDGPVEAEKFVRRNADKPPSDWYRTWLNWIKNAVKYEAERQASRPTTNGKPSSTVDRSFANMQAAREVVERQKRA